jgi:hypothetical protein
MKRNMKRNIKKKVLLKDIVIPADTIFTDESGRISRYGNGVFCVIVGLTDNSYGELIYSMDEDDDELDGWFKEI